MVDGIQKALSQTVAEQFHLLSIYLKVNDSIYTFIASNCSI